MPNARSAKTTREKAAQLRAEQERLAARRRTLTIGISVVAVLAVLIGGTVFVRTLSNQQKEKEAAASKPPANVYTTSTGVAGVLYGKATAKPTVTIFEDFLCPVCKEFEQADGSMLRSYADQGKIKVVYKPVAILSDRTSTDYSTRAGSAAAAVLNVAPDKWFAFHDALFTNQPAENSAGLPDTQLVDLAVQAGVAKDKVETAITGDSFDGWVSKGTDDFLKTYNGTPTVLLNGTQVKDLSPATFKAAVDKAIAAG